MAPGAQEVSHPSLGAGGESPLLPPEAQPVAGERGGHCCCRGREDPGHCTQTFHPAQGRARRGLRLTQTGRWHRSPLSQGKISAATLEQERNENRDTGHRVCFHWLRLLGTVDQQPLLPERSLLHRYLQRHL